MEEFLRSDYMPHGHCYLWEPSILWTNVISDLIIATAYFSIPIVLIVLVLKKRTQGFTPIIVLFAIFILSCGITHVYSIYTIWHGSYGIHGVLKAITAIASALTAAVLFKNIDHIIAVPTIKELRSAEKKAAEKKIKIAHLEHEQKTNAMFKFVLELIPTGVLVINAKQEIQITNKMLEQSFGYASDELIGCDINILVDQSQSAEHKQLVTDYMRVGGNKDMASGRLVWGRTKDNVAIPVEVSLSVHEFEQEKYTFACVTDVSEVGLQKERFLRSSRRIQRAIDATDVGIWEWNLVNNQLWFSPKLMKFFGQDKAKHQMNIADWQAHVHPDDKPTVEAELLKHQKEGTPYDAEYRGKDHLGNYRWLRTRGDSIFDDNGKPILMSGTLVDISDSKEREMQVINLARDFTQTFEQAAVGIAHVEPTGQFIRVNQRACDILGYPKEELMQLSFQDISFQEDLAADLSQLQQLLQGEIDNYTLEKRYVHKQGHLVWARITVSFVTSNAAPYLIAVIESIDEQKRLYADLQRSNQELEQFAYVASHDLKEPIRTLQTYTSYLITDLESGRDDRVAQDKAFIQSASIRMTALIDDLLRFSRVGSASIDKRQVDLFRVISDVQSDLSLVIEEKGATIELDPAIGSVYTDPSQLGLVIQNLIQNACKFCPPERSPRIKITADHLDDVTKIHIEDNGIGIAPEHQTQIFGLFKRLHTSSDYHGTGLGLAISQKIAQRLGGSIELNSELGKGSRFTLVIPSAEKGYEI